MNCLKLPGTYSIVHRILDLFLASALPALFGRT